MQLLKLTLAMPRGGILDHWSRIERWLPSLVCWQRRFHISYLWGRPLAQSQHQRGKQFSHSMACSMRGMDRGTPAGNLRQPFYLRGPIIDFLLKAEG